MQKVLDAIAHIEQCTGDPDAWRQGLAPTELAVLLPAAVVDERVVTGLLTKIRANHPTLFERTTGVPITPAALPPAAPPPPADGPGQQGEAATAMKKAEDSLAQQNSTAAQLDLHVVTAILNAHATTVESGGQLRALQQEVEDAVRARTDLDTPAGARDFQRYLIGKLRQIGAVVETAHLDDTSKAALASAWTALYESSKSARPTPPASAPSTDRATRSDPALPPYGADDDLAGVDPLLDQMLGDDLGWPQAGSAPDAPAAPAASPPPTVMTGLPGLGGGAAPPAGGLGGALPPALGLPRPEESQTPGPGGPADEMSLADLLGEEDGLPEDDEIDSAADELVDEEPDAEDSAVEVPPPSGPTVVHLPNGDTVTAPNPQIAGVITAAVGGTPILEAFRQEGMTVPPPGTAVAHPLDPSRLRSGDLGQFTDRQALALDRDRALFNGQIQSVTSVGGPSFLGWLHPPNPGTTTPSTTSPTTPPEHPGTPPPTRPATSAERTG
ncbi:MAG: DUF4226 domain-containing protein [Mycobacterium sp.]